MKYFIKCVGFELSVVAWGASLLSVLAGLPKLFQENSLFFASQFIFLKHFFSHQIEEYQIRTYKNKLSLCALKCNTKYVWELDKLNLVNLGYGG